MVYFCFEYHTKMNAVNGEIVDTGAKSVNISIKTVSALL